jgi:membrane protein implicated in regulation of membrane protease activity
MNIAGVVFTIVAIIVLIAFYRWADKRLDESERKRNQ